jgi:hypothetical protein
MRTNAFGLVLMLLCAGCKAPPTQTQAAAPKQTAQPPTADSNMSRDTLWQRRRECAAAIDDVLKHSRWENPTRMAGSNYLVVGSDNHYNELQDRCYVRIAVVNQGADTKNGVPFASYYIYDAFDGNTNITCSDEATTHANFCLALPGKDAVYDCGQCRAVAKDLMTK